MRRSFYQYIKTMRDPYKKDDMTLLANAIDKDGAFPKHSTQYNELSDYLEMNGDYVISMDVFDKVYQMYEDNNK